MRTKPVLVPLIYSMAMLFVFAACSSEPKSFEEEVRQSYQGERGFFFIKVPPALLTLALKIADDNEMTEFFGDARQVGIISFGEGFPSSENPALVKILEEMLGRWEYEDLMKISDADRTISMKMKEEGGDVTELVTIVSQTGGPVMALTLSGKINLQTVVTMAADFDFEKLLQMQGMGRN